MSETYQIRRMQAGEVQLAIDWAAREGWNPGLHDANCFYQADPNGFFVGELAGKAIAVGSAVVYDDRFAFCGLYIVHPDYRGHGYGIALTRERLRYVGERNAGIDGVIENIPIYQRIGYRLAYHNMRFQGLAVQTAIDDAWLQPLAQISFSTIENYDRQCFPALRSAFLKAWIEQPESLAFGFIEQGVLRGYAVRRRCLDGYKIGPLFADDYAIAERLLLRLQQDIVGEPFYLDITDINPAAQRLVQNQAMQPVFSTGRMYLKGQPQLADEKIFGITSFELG
ncbi:MAG: GNAT family N-acetyltransferase [Gammaproteobacteria bacterium]